MNFADDGPVRCELNSRTAGGALPSPKAIHVIRDGKLTTQDWDGKAQVIVPRNGATIMEWEVLPIRITSESGDIEFPIVLPDRVVSVNT